MVSRSMTRAKLVALFDRSLEDASEALGVSTTMTKRLCRKFGIAKWPYRRLTSIDTQISSKEQQREAAVLAGNYSKIAILDAALQALHIEKTCIMEGAAPGGRPNEPTSVGSFRLQPRYIRARLTSPLATPRNASDSRVGSFCAELLNMDSPTSSSSPDEEDTPGFRRMASLFGPNWPTSNNETPRNVRTGSNGGFNMHAAILEGIITPRIGAFSWEFVSDADLNSFGSTPRSSYHPLSSKRGSRASAFSGILELEV